MGFFTEIVTDYTLRNVALGAMVLGLTSGVLGVFAVLRRQSLLGDALSHAALPGVCLGFMITGTRQVLPILVGALLVGIVAAQVVLFIVKSSRVKEDAALGIVLSVFFAFGTVLLTYIQNQNNAGQAGLDTFLYGQAAAILPGDIYMTAAIGSVAVIVVLLLWKEVKLVSFDPEFAATIGIRTRTIEAAITGLIAFAVVIGLQMVGVVLMSAMLVAPAAAARQWTDRLGRMVVISALIAAVSGVLGARISASGEGLSTGPVIVLVVSAAVVVSLLFAPGRGVLWTTMTRFKDRARLRRKAVLVGIYQLALLHDDPEYPAEMGMINALFQTNARAVLKDLEGRDWVRPTEHMEEEGEHWTLTSAGHEEAQRWLTELEGRNT